jgi:phosphate transport system protein
MRMMGRRRERDERAGPLECSAPSTVIATDTLDLREIDGGVRSMFSSMPGRLAAAGDAFVHGDRDAARGVVESDPAIDALQVDIEAWVQIELTQKSVSQDDLRYLITVLRIVPELERSADLIEHIALRAQPVLSHGLSARSRGLVEHMTCTAVAMWREAGDAFERRDASAIGSLRVHDDQLDDLHVRLTSELAKEKLEASIAIELGLVARFFERLGDHAVNVVGRLAYITEPTPTPS